MTDFQSDRVRPDCDIIFLITGKPLPAMLDMAFAATNEGMKTMMVILERGIDDLVVDRTLVNYEIATIHVPYRSVDLKRFLSLPTVLWKVRRQVKSRLKPGGILVSGSYDLLLFAWMIAVGRTYRLRHQVRDLHVVQLATSFVSRVLVAVERFLLRRVELIMVSSPEFANKYYRGIYEGEIVLLENTPKPTVWEGFRRTPAEDGFLTIGYIGIMRYKRSLLQLISAVERVSDPGMKIRVAFAGGGETADLRSHITRPELFSFDGSYEYARDIKRLYAPIDLIYSVYDSEDLNCQVAMPNKFYESIITGIPILVASKTFVGQEVDREGIGTSVLSGDVEGLVGLLEQIPKPDSWYNRALTSLAGADADAYHASYDAAMKRSVSY